MAIPDPQDARFSLYLFDSLPEDKRSQVQAVITDGVDPLTWMLKRDQLATLRKLLPTVPEWDRNILRAYKIEREVTDLDTGEVLTKKLSGLPEEYVKEYGQACRWLAFMSDPQWKKKEARLAINASFLTTQDFYSACATVFKADGVKLPTNYAKLVAKIKEYKAEGAACVISKAWGNTISRKVGEEQLDYLVELFSDPRKPGFDMVATWFNDAAFTRAKLGPTDWKEVTTGTVKNQLMAKDVQPLWWMARHGFESWKSKFEYTMICSKPTGRDVQWVIDGTKVNKRYRTSKGISAQLKVLAVMDVASEMFLGWSFSETENYLEVAKAVRMATRVAGGVRPFQFLYDGDRSNLAFFKGMAGLHYKAMPYNGQSKTIEGVFKRLQTMIMKADLNFTGQNIRSRSMNSRENLDVMTKEFVENLPDLDGCIAQAEKELHIWNNTPGKDGKSPKQRYLASENPQPQYMTAEDEVEAFWMWKDQPIQYRKDGLRMRKDGRDYVFEAVEEVDGMFTAGVTEMVPDLAFHSRFVGESFWVKYDPEAIGDRVALYLGEDKRFVGFAVSKKAMPRAIMDHTSTTRAEINVRLTVKKDQAQSIIVKQTDRTSRLMDAEEALKMGHRWLPKDVESAAEADFLAAQETAPKPRKLPNSGPLNIGGLDDRAAKSNFLKNVSFDQ